MENGVSIHIVYNYITIVIIVMFIGHFLFQRNMKYCILIGSIFLSISLLGQLLSSIFLYPYSGNRVLAELPGIYQVVMMVIAESVIIAGCLTLKKIIERIPPHLSSINVMTIFIPLLLNIIVMAVCTDNLYNDKKVIIYSANTMNNIFHEAWNLADSRLAKNALPYQFQNLVEKYSLEFYNN